MSIYGIGTDIVDISRIKIAFNKNKNFKKKIFSLNEIKTIESKLNKITSYAKRFAAKEAFAKALGTGISKGINFNEIIVMNKKNGKPFIKLKGKTMEIIKKKFKKKAKISLSLSDEKKYAVAFATISL
jgi:holo-[acyl-carrier protein] synthase